MDFAADLDLIISDFAIPATVGGVSVQGIFDNAYTDAFNLVGGTRPALTVSAAALPAVSHGAAVTLNGTAYTVGEIHPDGTGLLVLILEKA